MGLTSHLSDAYDAVSSSCFSFSSLLSPMKMSLTNMTMKVLGPGSPPVHALFHFFSENSVGRVSSSKSVGHVSGLFYVGRVGVVLSVGRVSGILKVGRIGELIRIGKLI